MTDQADDNIVSKAEFARRNSWSKSYVTKLKDEGRLVLTEDNQVMVAESLARIAETTGAPERASAPAVSPQYRGDRDRKEFYDAENARLDLEARLGRTLGTADVRGVCANVAVTLRTRLETWPARLAPQLAALGGNEASIRRFLTDHVEQALAEISRGFAKLDDLAKRGQEG
jgi:hypothetical protein